MGGIVLNLLIMTDENSKKEAYRVLARKYRPQNFDELIGQDALVRTLKNAIESGRIAHAFMLTGIRGTGKTTTARIIAKALNYTGADGKSGPTTGDTSDCDICKAIAEDRHPDVIEMDAASHTGVDDVREILDGVRYAPSSARYKIYIIDEVHMLSKSAFNALLKTLEEPPEHVKFIFATTEIRKVPVTVLSRCQRFDLRRIDAETLAAYYKEIAEKEGVKTSDEALTMIGRAADGSVRDGLSLLDQAISLSADEITAEQVRDMLGLADRGKTLDMLEHAIKGECGQALDMAADLYSSGADAVTLIQDMLDFVHMLTKARAVPNGGDAHTMISPDMKERITSLAAKMSMPSLSRAWQILLKGIGEVNTAPNPQAAAEMILIRLSYASNLPDPNDLLKKIKGDMESGAVQQQASVQQAAPAANAERTPEPVAKLRAIAGGGTAAIPAPSAEEDQETEFQVGNIETLTDVELLLQKGKHLILAGQVHHNMHLVKMERGRIEFRPTVNASQSLSSDLAKAMTDMTGERWVVSVSPKADGEPTLAMQTAAAEQAKINEVKAHPIVKEVLDIFPDAQVKVRTKQQ